MEHASHWRDFFRAWPAGVDRRGVIVTSFGEQIPFNSFMPSDALMILDRSVPDTSGARKVVLAYNEVVAVKLTDVIKNKAFLPLGFMEPPHKGPSSSA